MSIFRATSKRYPVSYTSAIGGVVADHPTTRRYFARVAKVFPPPAIRALAAQRAAHQSNPNGSQIDPDDFTPVAHHLGIDLAQDPATVAQSDNAEAYLYTVQLMDENHNFEGSFMEVPSKQLSRDRLTFSKSILKRYMRECVQREPIIAAPWVVKPAIAAIFGISGEQSEEAEAKNREIREGKLAKRRKNVDEDGVPIAPKRRRAEPGERRQPVELKKALKYPIEDLELDPLTIHDGRTLRRVNQELPPLPPKPKPSRDLLVPAGLFDDFIVAWNMLNVFGKPIGLSTFSLDDFASALYHHTNEPKCVLLAEVHACLTNVIGSDHSRVFGQTGAAPLAFGAVGALDQAEDGPVTRDSSVAPEAQVAGDVDELASNAEGADEMAVDQNGAGPEDEEFDALIRKGVHYSRRWDRSAKLKVAEGREGWERHMVGALCQRGGPIVMDSLPAILRHLFEGADLSPPVAGTSASESAHAVVNGGKVDNSNPEVAYLSLPLEHKLSILNYLCTLALGSKAVRGYIEECETTLTDLRKQRADVNKERKALLERRAELEGKNKKEDSPVKVENGTATPAPDDTPGPTLLPPGSPQPDQANGHSNGDVTTLPPPSEPASETDHAVKPDEMEAAVNEAAEDEDMLADDDDASETASAAGSSVAGCSRRAPKSALSSLDPPRSLSASKQRAEARLLKLSARELGKAQRELDAAFAANLKSEDRVEREFRRYKNVSRCQPLGKDRFHCRYWWFDGVGGMSLVGGVHGGSVQYGTGRLLVQGPSREDWEGMCARREEEGAGVKAEEEGVDEVKAVVEPVGEEGMRTRRKREEVDDEAILGVNEWAYYDDEAQVSGNNPSRPRGTGTRVLTTSARNRFPAAREPAAVAQRQGHARACAPQRPRKVEGLLPRRRKEAAGRAFPDPLLPLTKAAVLTEPLLLTAGDGRAERGGPGVEAEQPAGRGGGGAGLLGVEEQAGQGLSGGGGGGSVVCLGLVAFHRVACNDCIWVVLARETCRGWLVAWRGAAAHSGVRESSPGRTLGSLMNSGEFAAGLGCRTDWWSCAGCIVACVNLPAWTSHVDEEFGPSKAGGRERPTRRPSRHLRLCVTPFIRPTQSTGRLRIH